MTRGPNKLVLVGAVVLKRGIFARVMVVGPGLGPYIEGGITIPLLSLGIIAGFHRVYVADILLACFETSVLLTQAISTA